MTTTKGTYSLSFERCTTYYVIKFASDAAGRWFSPGYPVSSTNKTDRHDIAEIVLKVELNNIKQTNKQITENSLKAPVPGNSIKRTITRNTFKAPITGNFRKTPITGNSIKTSITGRSFKRPTIGHGQLQGTPLKHQL